jgi:O-antigen/teichoic acid export membrane protein
LPLLQAVEDQLHARRDSELVEQANQVLVPTISTLQERDPLSIPVVYRESYRMVFFLTIPTFAFLTVASPVVSLIWIGREEPIFVHFVALLAAGWIVNILANPAYVVDLGTGALRWVSIGCGITAALNAALGFVAGKYITGTAVVGAYVFSLILGYAVVIAAYHIENRVPLAELLPKESFGVLFSSLAGAALFLPLATTWSAHSWLSPRVAFGFCAAAVAIIVVPMWLHPMRKRLLNWAFSRLPA